ncbi:MAG: hypothetical protein M3Y72_12835 [Acidobacteriota bacterium]|nr:hypothetical protein [Acidobacteriota bacterium]
MKIRLPQGLTLASFAALLAAQSTAFAAVTVLTVPWIPKTPTTPHVTYPVNATTESPIVLGATVPSAVSSTDSFTVTWNFGDGSPATAFALTNPYDISTTHQYPASAATGTQWTAVVTVTDTTTSESGSAKYYVIQEPVALASRVNVAIDWGLWYMHQTMWRNTNTKGLKWGGWDTQTYACNNVNGQAFDCFYYGVINAANIQAYEVNGHLQNGPAADPYTDDVTRAMARMFNFIATQPVASKTYDVNPATANYGCTSGFPTPSDPNCAAPATRIFYNPGATSCSNPPCSYTFDGNHNGFAAYSSDGSNEPIYTGGQFMDAIVASETPAATAATGPANVAGETFKNVVQDMADYYNFCQYNTSSDVSKGYTRGGNYQGGGWWYSCQTGDDNSVSQWAAIGLIGGQRGTGFGISIPPIVRDFNQIWVTNSQDVQSKPPTGADPWTAGDDNGAFGYNGSAYYSLAWGPFATTPSGMVQMAMDEVGRTTNTTFGDKTNAADQRWNNAETWYADNFCNTTASGAYYAPRAYTYGMFSFFKSMLLHDPSGSQTPIQFLRTQTPNVFPNNQIDWYGALSSANGGAQPCDGFGQTLVSYQLTPASGTFDGHWYGHDYSSEQFPFETAWSLIILKGTLFSSCVNNLAGAGSISGSAPARIDLSWTNQVNSNSYNVLRGATAGGPYTQVGNTTKTSFSDTSGLVNGDTYFYVVQPLNGTEQVCASNEATVTVPKTSGRH